MVGQISHDLRTPLNSITINLDMAVNFEKTILEEPKRKYLRPALNNCKLLLCIINDILDFTEEEVKKELRANL